MCLLSAVYSILCLIFRQILIFSGGYGIIDSERQGICFPWDVGCNYQSGTEKLQYGQKDKSYCMERIQT